MSHCFYLELNPGCKPGPDLPLRINLPLSLKRVDRSAGHSRSSTANHLKSTNGGFFLGREGDVKILPNQRILDAIVEKFHVGGSGKLNRETLLSRRHLRIVGIDSDSPCVIVDCLGRTWLNGVEIQKGTEAKTLRVSDVVSLGAPEFGCNYTLRQEAIPSRGAAKTTHQKHGDTKTDSLYQEIDQKHNSGTLHEVQGDFLYCQEEYLFIQTDCISENKNGLCKRLYEKFPYAIPGASSSRRSAGTISVHGAGDPHKRKVVNIYGPSKGDTIADNSKAREKYFDSALRSFEKRFTRFKSAAFPFGIGCGSAGEEWPRYLSILRKFAARNRNAKVVVYGNKLSTCFSGKAGVGVSGVAPVVPVMTTAQPSSLQNLQSKFNVCLGTLALGVMYPDPSKRPSRCQAISLIRNAIMNHGIRFIDTADTYCESAADIHYCEQLIAECLVSLPENIEKSVVVATKGGMERFGDGHRSASWRPRKDLTPDIIRAMIRASRLALSKRRADGSEPPLDLWMLHHCDSYPPRGAAFAALLISANTAVSDGDVLSLGICNASTEHVRVAREILGDKLVAVSNSYSLWDHVQADKPCPSKSGKTVSKSNKSGVIQLCQELGVAFLAYAPFGGLRSRDGRRSLVKSFPGLLPIAASRGVSCYTLCLQWMRDRWSKRGAREYCTHVIPIVGMRSGLHLPALGVLTKTKFTDFPLRDSDIDIISAMSDKCKASSKRKRSSSPKSKRRTTPAIPTWSPVPQ